MRFASGEFYHIYNRGVEGRDIFVDDSDYHRVLRVLNEFNDDESVRLDRSDEMRSRQNRLASLLCYVLMQNHVHLLIRCVNEEKLALFLQKIFIGYTMYFNTKYQRKGVLFQGRSKSKHIDGDRYLNHIFDYIHLNPLDYTVPEWREYGVRNIEKAQVALLNYPWSSINGILQEKLDPRLDYETIKDLFPDLTTALKSALEWSSEKFEDVGPFITEN
jgi:putative transposase